MWPEAIDKIMGVNILDYFLRNLPDWRIKHKELQKYPWLLNFPNGINYCSINPFDNGYDFISKILFSWDTTNLFCFGISTKLFSTSSLKTLLLYFIRQTKWYKSKFLLCLLWMCPLIKTKIIILLTIGVSRNSFD